MKIEDAVRKSGGVWPKRLLSKGSIDVMLLDGSDGRIKACTRAEFEECARRLRNEPSFADHPDAKCFVQDSLGSWYKQTESADVAPSETGGWNTLSGKTEWKFVSKGEVIGDWKQTLRLRPEESKMENKNDWHKRGEFPPVGTVCEVLYYGGWERTKIIGWDDGVIVVTTGWDEIHRYNKLHVGPSDFRPLQTERELLIKKAYEVAADSHCLEVEDTVKSLLDAGMLKMPEDK